VAYDNKIVTKFPRKTTHWQKYDYASTNVTETLGNTLSIGPGAATADQVPCEPVLILALECGRPAAGSVRIRLATLSSVLIGRGSERTISSDAATANIKVPDKWMSSQHAKLESSFGRWILVDTDSKNGCAVDGHSTKRAVLTDGAVIELGHTMFIFCQAFEIARDAQTITEAYPDASFVHSWQSDIDRVQRVSSSEIPVLIEGESGVGKEVLARAIHRLSKRDGAFVAVNCGALPEHLVESELFGHRKGAFSGAVADHDGLIRAADGGTLFLDEIGDLPLAAQASLLRVLQEREVMPVGGTRAIAVNLRVVAATHRDLDSLVSSQGFRHDLFARLAGFRVEVPALAERRADLGFIIGTLFTKTFASSHPGFELDAARALFRYPWPLNIRELEQALSTASVLAATSSVAAHHLPETVRSGRPPGAPKPVQLNEIDQRIRDDVHAAMREHNGNISAVARALQKDRKQIQRWVKRFGLDPNGYK
jgi:transcriptional regulator of acetoin/glycerol metabolism